MSLPIRGSYILLLKLPEDKTISFGSRQGVHFPRGYYAYVGSAMGGFKARINHHLKGAKKPHWHIDYLLPEATITSIILGETKDRTECVIAQALDHQLETIPGFGASDCQCSSHLFFASTENTRNLTIMKTLGSLGISPIPHSPPSAIIKL